MSASPDMRVDDAFRAGVALLAEAGIENPALDAAVILGHVTGRAAPGLLLEREAPLAGDQAALYRALIERRCRRETVSRIVGQREFYSRMFAVTPRVLDPRPDTEVLVDEALSWLSCVEGPVRVLEVGTGSGAIAVTVAAEAPRATVTATDISRDALNVAARNAAAHGVADRVGFLLADLGEGLAPVPAFDLVLSNPPYIASREWDRLPEDVRAGDPRTALVAGPEGTEFYAPLARLAVRILRPGGRIMVEVGAGQSAEVSSLFRNAGLKRVAAVTDLAGIERVVTGSIGRA